MQNVNFSQILKELDGSDSKWDETEPLTFRKVCLVALNGNYDNEKPSIEQKMHRAVLAIEIFKNESLDLKAEDVVLLKDVINKCFKSPMAVAQAIWILEGKSFGGK